MAVGDFNGDGKLDLVVANQSSDTVSVLLGTGTGTFGAKVDYPTGPNPFSMAVGDVNDDGRPDLAAANQSSDTVSVILNAGAPSAANVTISGRVLTSGGGGLRNASVNLTDDSGQVRSVLTNAFGYYSFNGVGSGHSYVIGASAKRYTFGRSCSRSTTP